MSFAKSSFAALLLSAGMVAVAAPAAAQDVSWDGFYAGVNAGVGWGDSDSYPVVTTSGVPSSGAPISSADLATINSVGDVANSHKTGFQGGIEAGYNWQSEDGLVLGIEGDIGIFDLGGERSKTFTSPLLINPPRTYTVNSSLDTDWLATVRGRVGYATGPVLLYGTAGIAFTEGRTSASLADNNTPQRIVSGTNSQTKTGWTLGAGAGYKISEFDVAQGRIPLS